MLLTSFTVKSALNLPLSSFEKSLNTVAILVGYHANTEPINDATDIINKSSTNDLIATESISIISDTNPAMVITPHTCLTNFLAKTSAKIIISTEKNVKPVLASLKSFSRL